jgi:hypothetical protein
MANKKVLVTNADNTVINVAQDDSVTLLRRILKVLESNAVVDSVQRQRVAVEQGTAANLNCTIAGTASTTAVASTVNMGQVVVNFGGQAQSAATQIDSRFFIIDTARNAYANGIRSKLTW